MAESPKKPTVALRVRPPLQFDPQTKARLDAFRKDLAKAFVQGLNEATQENPTPPEPPAGK